MVDPIKAARERAETAAAYVRDYLHPLVSRNKSAVAEVAIVLGSGWPLPMGFGNNNDEAIHCSLIPGFEGLGVLAGHNRILRYGAINRKPVLILDGRIHLNEAPASPKLYEMVRLQVEMLFHLGVKKLILTCVAGSLQCSVHVGDLVVIDGFISLFAPDMPLYAGEFCAPDDVLTSRISDVPLQHHRGGYVMLRGPQFEGRKYDKDLLTQTGAKAVGMSMYPEACVAAVYKASVHGVCFITNSAHEPHSHEENLRRVQSKGVLLSQYLEEAVALI